MYCSIPVFKLATLAYMPVVALGSSPSARSQIVEHHGDAG